MRTGLLAPYRVVDVTDENGWLCGRLLADLGADVVKVEPPGGDLGRRLGAFVGGKHGDPEASLDWWFANRGKRSVVLDVAEASDRADLERLIRDADVLIESWGPGGLAARGLDADRLLALNPRLVVTSISAYGTDGPYTDRTPLDLIVVALSGQMWLMGDPERPPVRISVPQSARVGSIEAAVHTMMALQHAAQTGEGQRVDVAALPAMVRTLLNATEFKINHDVELVRSGGRPLGLAFSVRHVYPCADGHVTIITGLNRVAGPTVEYLRSTLIADGYPVPEIMDGIDVFDPDVWTALEAEGRGPELIAAVEDTAFKVFATRTKADLYRTALDQLLLLAPVNDLADLRRDEQLAFREYWVPVEGIDAADGPVVFPGAWAKPSKSPLVNGTVARIGEHTKEVLSEPARPAPAPPTKPTGEAALAGLKIWDLTWVGVGPLTTRYFGDYGATVIKVENTVRADVLRSQPPFAGATPGINRSQFFADFNASKLSIGIDMTHPLGLDVVRRRIAWADVVAESFTPKTLSALGLDYDHLREINPGLVMLSTCMQGQTGPNRDYRGFGQMAAALCGFYEITGWPDLSPAMVYGAYTDFMSQRFCATVLLAAIDHQRRTGEGQHIDVSQYEASLQLLGPELLDYGVNGVIRSREGNRDASFAPHGVFPCRPVGDGIGGQRWVAIACQTDDEWLRLVSCLGSPGWAKDAALETVAGRKAAEDEIEAELAAWTASREMDDVVRVLDGVTASAPVWWPDATHDDAQLRHLGYYQTLEHPVMGPQRYNGMAARMSATPGNPHSAAPCLGEHTLTVLTDVLGYDEDEIGELFATGAVEINDG